MTKSDLIGPFLESARMFRIFDQTIILTKWQSFPSVSGAGTNI